MGQYRDKLQGLLREVTALANQLRRAAAVPRPTCAQVGGWGVLQLLERQGPLTVPSIARYRAVSRQSTQTQVNRLVSEGLVALAANPAHKRSVLVQLTHHGRRVLAAAMARELPSSTALLSRVAESRLVSAARLLGQVREALMGKNLPAVEAAAKQSPQKRAAKPPESTDRRDTEPPGHESQNQPEPALSEESEFPLSLL